MHLPLINLSTSHRDSLILLRCVISDSFEYVELKFKSSTHFDIEWTYVGLLLLPEILHRFGFPEGVINRMLEQTRP